MRYPMLSGKNIRPGMTKNQVITRTTSRKQFFDLFVWFIWFECYAILKNIWLIRWRPALWQEECGKCPTETRDHPQLFGRPSHVCNCHLQILILDAFFLDVLIDNAKYIDAQVVVVIVGVFIDILAFSVDFSFATDQNAFEIHFHIRYSHLCTVLCLRFDVL